MANSKRLEPCAQGTPQKPAAKAEHGRVGLEMLSEDELASLREDMLDSLQKMRAALEASNIPKWEPKKP